jgi:hypothetical protein
LKDAFLDSGGAAMQDAETMIRTPHSREDPSRDSVSIKDRGLELLLFFDRADGAPLVEVRLLPDVEQLTPVKLREFLARSTYYERYARTVIADFWGDPARVRALVKRLRDFGSTRRGLSDEFYRVIARDHAGLMEEREPHIVKAMAALHAVTPGAASRWIKEAKRRGYIEAANDA